MNFENVGGAVLDTALSVMNRHSRIVVCGLIAEYNATEPYGYKRMRSVLVNRIRMQGMIVFDWKDPLRRGARGVRGASRRGQAQVSRIDRRRTRQRAARPDRPAQGRELGKQLVRMA